MTMLVCVQLLVPIIFLTTNVENQVLLKHQQKIHQPQALTNNQIKHVSELSNLMPFVEYLDNILIPRVVGTPNHEKVFNYIKNELDNLHWHVAVDEFQQKVPYFGKVTFKNIIATVNPKADRFLVLACHYDSKYFKDAEFVGAIDSAVPCAMMLNLAKTFGKHLLNNSEKISLKLIFFDGEEAFREWGPNDSIYGAKHLAKVYHNNRHSTKTTGEIVSDLDKIDVLILLDLIGHSGTRFQSHFKNTEKWYVRMVEIEKEIRKLEYISNDGRVYFEPIAGVGRIEDDHLPFLAKGVPILHLISTPFPPEWHTPADNRKIIDTKAVEDISTILNCFVAEYLQLFIEDINNTSSIPAKEL